MNGIELFLLVAAYTMLCLTIFLEVICYTRKIETWETIAFTASLLLLIVSLTISPLLGNTDALESTSAFTLIAMLLVGLTLTINTLAERKHSLTTLWKKTSIVLCILLFIGVLVGRFVAGLEQLEYAVIAYLVVSIVFSMLLIRNTEPQNRIAHREKIERRIAIAFIILVPLSIALTYAFGEFGTDLSIGFTLPVIFILIAGSKLWDDVQRLSLFRTGITPKAQHFKNFSLTQREQEIALELTKRPSV